MLYIFVTATYEKKRFVKSNFPGIFWGKR